MQDDDLISRNNRWITFLDVDRVIGGERWQYKELDKWYDDFFILGNEYHQGLDREERGKFLL